MAKNPKKTRRKSTEHHNKSASAPEEPTDTFRANPDAIRAHDSGYQEWIEYNKNKEKWENNLDLLSKGIASSLKARGKHNRETPAVSEIFKLDQIKSQLIKMHNDFMNKIDKFKHSIPDDRPGNIAKVAAYETSMKKQFKELIDRVDSLKSEPDKQQKILVAAVKMCERNIKNLNEKVTLLSKNPIEEAAKRDSPTPPTKPEISRRRTR